MLAESLLWVYLDAYGPHWVILETTDFEELNVGIEESAAGCWCEQKMTQTVLSSPCT